MTDIALQKSIVDLLYYIEYWSTINTALAWLALAFVVITVIALIATLEMEDDGEGSFMKGVFYTVTLSIIACALIVAQFFTPSSDAELSKLTLYSSQLPNTAQNCRFLTSLYENNRTFSRNTSEDPSCKKKKIIDDLD